MRALRPPATSCTPRASGAARRRRRCAAAPCCVGVRFSEPPPPPPRRAPRPDDPAGDSLRGPRDACQTPHSGYHDDGARRRFFEGWYFRVTLPLAAGGAPGGDSFAFMYSCEDATGGADGRGRLAGVGAQVMGPRDSYLCRHARDVAPFWAWRHRLGLGHAFATAPGAATPAGPLPAEAFAADVAEGFQATATWHQGSLKADDRTAGPGPPSTAASCAWAFAVEPRFGWGGGPDAVQKATAGWLAALPVFEPHWQVLMSHGLATGHIDWDGRRFAFRDAPFYAEKNWGGAFPRKWFWAQCNAFEGEPDLALTVGGGVRDLPLLGRTEDVALIGVTWRGAFIELVPWSGVVTWQVSPWGSWRVRGVSATHEVEVVAACAPGDGTPLRAPTASRGLAAACRDTFAGELTLAVWARDGAGGKRLLLTARSTQAALEVGGGPWFDTWAARAAMAQPLRALAAMPLDVGALAQVAPPAMRPPGL